MASIFIDDCTAVTSKCTGNLAVYSAACIKPILPAFEIVGQHMRKNEQACEISPSL